MDRGKVRDLGVDNQMKNNDQSVKNVERNILENVELELQVVTNVVKRVTLSKTAHV